MKSFLLSILFFIFLQQGFAQFSFKGIVKDTTTKQPLAGVTVVFTGDVKKTVSTNRQGIVSLNNLSQQLLVLDFTSIGYQPLRLTINLPDTVTREILLTPEANVLSDVVVVASLRNNERIENATTKVEVLGQEEMNEESTVKPSSIASILGDVSSVQIQQSSAISGNSNIRVQGLDGRYTQILRDGMPLYGGYAGSFGVLSVPPLDLKQIELIKGSSSTLYGGGAIGGLVNLVSKRPAYKPEASFLANQTTLKETNLNAYYAQRWKKIGFTFFGGQTFQKAVDVNKDGFSDVPDLKSTLIHPVLFLYPNEKIYLAIGWSGSFETRTGGDMIAIDDRKETAHPFFEENKLHRNIFTFQAEDKINNTLTLNLKASLSIFKRTETTNTYYFTGDQKNYFTEASIVKRFSKHHVVAGINFTGDQFSPSEATPIPVGSFSNSIAGIFAQDTWQIGRLTKLETGIRVDHHNQYGNFVLPRISLFHHLTEQLGLRMGFGMGYITPNPLSPQIRDYDIYKLQPIAAGVTAEKSYAGNIDLNYKTQFGDGNEFFINQSFFLTHIKDPIVGTEDASGNVSFTNRQKPVLTRGFDTYVQMDIKHWEFYLGYTYTDALRKYLDENQFMPITPRNRAAATAVFELDGKWRVGVEASYNSYQYREDYSKTPGYLFMAAMIERKIGTKWSIVLNCENLFDERQSKHESLYTGSITNPIFKTLWAPIDGRAINLCLRYRPFAQ